jgi:N6-L-threonylcarbamoyladenine synthase
VLKIKRAMEQCEERGVAMHSVLVGGGVSANSRLRSAMQDLTHKRGVSLLIPDLAYCMDNAAMIGGLGFEMLRHGMVSGLDLQPVPTTAC